MHVRRNELQYDNVKIGSQVITPLPSRFSPLTSLPSQVIIDNVGGLFHEGEVSLFYSSPW
jgi:hypothetical protein